MTKEDIKVGERTLTSFSAPQGFVLYRGVVILFDVHGERDERVVTLIDSLSPVERTNLVAVEKHEGEVRFAWRYSIPECFALNKQVNICGDSWWINEVFEVSAP